MNRYEVTVESSIRDLEEEVNKYIKKGYEPIGSLIFNRVDYHSGITEIRYMQAVYSPKEYRRVYMYNGEEVTFDEYLRLTIKDVLDAESKA